MLTVNKKSYTPYDNIDNHDDMVVNYIDIFSKESEKELGLIDKITTDIASGNYTNIQYLILALFQVSGRIYGRKQTSDSQAYIFISPVKFDFTHKTDFFISTIAGSCVIFGKHVLKECVITKPDFCIVLYEQNILPFIYRDIASRLLYRKQVLEKLNIQVAQKKCIQKSRKLTYIAKGCFGNVFSTDCKGKLVAVKFSKISKDEYLNPYNTDIRAWHEVYILKYILNPLIEKKICPNIPLLYETLTCDSCSILLEEQIKTPCSITFTELAEGTLKKYLTKKRTIHELYNCLFQIMAGIHAYQEHGQVMNFDIKKENILYYKINKGGSWKYKIYGKDYYIPNLGYLFVVNDFGLSRPLCASHIFYKKDHHRLGARLGFVYKGKVIPFSLKFRDGENVKTLPLVKWQSDKNRTPYTEFRMNRKGFITCINFKDDPYITTFSTMTTITPKIIEDMNLQLEVPTKIKKYAEINSICLDCSKRDFFEQSKYIPPFEFFNDTQDCIRMFVGGKRTTQRGEHSKYIHNNIFYTELKKYKYPSQNCAEKNFPKKASLICAGYFIDEFFSEIYQVSPSIKDILETYSIS